MTIQKLPNNALEDLISVASVNLRRRVVELLNQLADIVNGVSPMSIPDGSVSAPGLSLQSNPDTGVYAAGPSVIAISIDGVRVAQVGARGLILDPVGSVGTPTMVIGNDTDSGWWLDGANQIGAASGGLPVYHITNTSGVGWLRPAGYFSVPDGVTAPPTTAGHAQIYVDTADGDLKVKFGDGTVKTLATDT